jgi:hypothetical protein
VNPFDVWLIDLGDLIEAFTKLPRDQILPIGLHKPHSYRGDYMDLAFEATPNATAGDVADMLTACVGETFEGYKGGDYTMTRDSWCWISEYGTSAGDRIGPVLLHLLTNQTTNTTPEA